MPRSLSVGLLLASAVLVSGQDRDHRPSQRGDERLIKEVRHELTMLPYYSVFDDLSYKVEGGTVTLYGQVIRPTLKSDAENAVKKIEAVERVVNNIELEFRRRCQPRIEIYIQNPVLLLDKVCAWMS